MINLFILVSSFLTISVNAQISDDYLTPLQRHEAGNLLTGAFNINNGLYCSKGAQELNTKPVFQDNYILQGLAPGYSFEVKNEVDGFINPLITQALDLLNDFQDPVVVSKHVCTGFYQEEAENHLGNALSYVQGYLIFDYTLIRNLLTIPAESRSTWAYNFLVFHEFSHQLQYWNNDIEVIKTINGEQNSKIPELAADCVASSLLNGLHLNSPDLIDLNFRGVVGAAHLLGDDNVDSPSHHGTSAERVLAVEYGARLAEANSRFFKSRRGALSSAFLIESCNSYAKEYLN